MSKLLTDDTVKLVFYSLVSIQRTRERVLETKAVVVSESMTAEAFVVWRIAEYFQEAQRASLPLEQRKYLRVHYEVRERWPKTDLRFQSRQLAHLEGIRKAIFEASLDPDGDRPPSPMQELSVAGVERILEEAAPGSISDPGEFTVFNQAEPNQAEPNQTEPNQTEPNQTEPNQTEPNQAATEASEALRELVGKPSREGELTASNEQILEVFERVEGSVAMRDLVAQTGLSRSSLAREVKELMELGRVERIGQGFATRYRQVLS
ncbi:MAG: MarR family transcriptional regulator [Deltaproteobacteria bacterium]|nr:MarR family transcriptional regulator [Deltaproteobacteria bacterium]